MDDTIGEQYPQPDPRGWLVFTGLPDALQRAEDATAAADRERFTSRPTFGPVERDATATETALLKHLGYEVDPLPLRGKYTADNPEPLKTTVTFVTGTLRNRRWPQVENQTLEVEN